MFKNLKLTNEEIERGIGVSFRPRKLNLIEKYIAYVRKAQYKFCVARDGYYKGIYPKWVFIKYRDKLKIALNNDVFLIAPDVEFALKLGYIDFDNNRGDYNLDVD